jgi:hypothetical protein
MKKWANELNRVFSKEKVQTAKKNKTTTTTTKSHEEMFTIPDHKENANQNHIKIPPHSC